MLSIRIGSRGSDLALWQANHVKQQLEALGAEVSITVIKTQGDQIQHLSFDKLEGKGFFTKEIEQALLDNEIDLAVHSHKDLETTPPEGLIIAAVSEREHPSDVLLIHPRAVDTTQHWNLKQKAVVGTSSARRKSQLVAFRDDTAIKDLRGNVPTRLQKLIDGEYDAILLAKAGLDRLNLDLSAVHVEVLDPEEFIPAPAQGVLALQIRETDTGLFEFMQALHHPDVQARIIMERTVLNRLQGGCQLPLGVYCPEEGRLLVSYAEAWEDGAQWFQFEGPHDLEMVDVVLDALLTPEEEDED
ncbi:MAG: hydroxymethylbilane synthase [Candidatus Fluviicola riflensis]|nr:MAG: hydroxymethylbilane synthase [Candidatus Fluviicola riflensis]OGS77879.1 MAG: hydroxymethylbilane synthase [Candidatus Fluviicola riflensis]OGS84944.1 MAG: hydroxymethylbilane synthase [Fluviicola sp. RIFCSPHIGHO2_01_FULL_43_53]OGS89216.1 MAG: hydroxymethylbilane synthase [Fluviicola sp. RIFCSPHIGHO2_12_FULL_43_24]